MRQPLVAEFDAALMGMFKAEWASQRGEAPIGRIAIVDDAPQEQYLYPEFLLTVEAFRRHGVEAVIADAAALRFDRGKLWVGQELIDLVYNRLVDFSLGRPEHAALHAAYLSGSVVVTPNPRNHALLADKRNLTVLCDRERLVELGLSSQLADAATGIPHTLRVTTENAAELWAARKGHISSRRRGTAPRPYTEAKRSPSVCGSTSLVLTMWPNSIPPGERMIELGAVREARKTDVRLFTYDGRVLLTAARLYKGQTTNFRTPGGGFAPVFFI